MGEYTMKQALQLYNEGVKVHEIARRLEVSRCGAMLPAFRARKHNVALMLNPDIDSMLLRINFNPRHIP